MKLTETQWLWGLAGAAAVGWGVYAIWGRGNGEQSSFYLPGQTANVYQGQQIIVRLPRGGYELMGDDGLVSIVTQVQRGINTDIALQIGSGGALPFTVTPTFVDTVTPGRSFQLVIIAAPVPRSE